jgi:hypothetical protein
MGFTLQGFGPFLHWLTLGILCVLPIVGVLVLYKLGSLPGEIARARNHPQADAISICGWMGIITLVMWPIAMVWAYMRPSTAVSAANSSAENVGPLLESLKRASKRLSALEEQLKQSTAPGGG